MKKLQVESEEKLVVNIIDRDIQLDLLRAAEQRPALEAEIVDDETEESPDGESSPHEEEGR